MWGLRFEPPLLLLLKQNFILSQRLHHFHIVPAHIIIHLSSKLECRPLLKLPNQPLNLNTFYGVPNSAHITKDSVSASILGTPYALQWLKAGKRRGTGRYYYYSLSQKLQWEFTCESKITIGKQTIPPVIMRQQCSISISFFFPVPWSTLTLADTFCLTVSPKSFVAKKAM